MSLREQLRVLFVQAALGSEGWPWRHPRREKKNLLLGGEETKIYAVIAAALATPRWQMLGSNTIRQLNAASELLWQPYIFMG